MSFVEEIESCLDHVIMFVIDLARGVEEFDSRFGTRPEFGGSHPDLGSSNALVSMGGSYLELLSSSKQSAVAQDFSLVAYAMRSRRLDEIAARAKEIGLNAEMTLGQRVDRDGVLLRWRGLELSGHAFAGCIPFFIDWGDTPLPSTTAPQGLSNPRLEVTHPFAEELNSIYSHLGIGIPVHSASQAGLRLRVMCEGDFVVFNGDAIGWKSALGF